LLVGGWRGRTHFRLRLAGGDHTSVGWRRSRPSVLGGEAALLDSAEAALPFSAEAALLYSAQGTPSAMVQFFTHKKRENQNAPRFPVRKPRYPGSRVFFLPRSPVMHCSRQPSPPGPFFVTPLWRGHTSVGWRRCSKTKINGGLGFAGSGGWVAVCAWCCVLSTAPSQPELGGNRIVLNATKRAPALQAAGADFFLALRRGVCAVCLAKLEAAGARR
jgi:hypothetical protein